MDKAGGEESRDYDQDGRRGEHGRSNYGTEISREYDRNQQRGDHERRESIECERSDHKGDQGGGGYERVEERGHHDSRQVDDERDIAQYKRPPRRRDLRHVNYAFSGPGEDVAEKEAQEWLDNLSRAGGEEENDPFKIWPKGQKYRTGTTNASPQMQERLQRCEEHQERHECRKHIPRLEKRNESADIYPVLHVEENQNKHVQAVPLKLWGNTRRSSTGNSSTSVYAVMHPASEDGDYLVRKRPAKVYPNYLREHRAAIAEMSAMTRFYKQKESEEEAKRLAAVKIWDGTNRLKKLFPKRVRACPDFVGRNVTAITEQSQYAREVREIPEPDYSFMKHRGKVPKYLRQRKREIIEQAEDRDREEMTKAIPEGKAMMLETERLQTMENLEQSILPATLYFTAVKKVMNKIREIHVGRNIFPGHKQLIRMLTSFPLVFDTARQIRIRSEIEQELAETEASHSYYNNPHIYLAESQPQSTSSAKSSLRPYRTSHSQFPQLDKPPELITPNVKDKSTVSSSTKAQIIPMTYSESICESCYAPMQRVIKARECRKPLRCTACTLKLKTRSRSLWALKKPVQHSVHVSR